MSEDIRDVSERARREEDVEQLVENRFVKDEGEDMPQKRSHKKKGKKGLTSLILLLSFVLIFAVFFVGSYVYFTGSQKPDKIADASSNAADSADKAESDKTAEVSDEKVNVPDTGYIDKTADEKPDAETKSEVKNDTKTTAPSASSQQPAAKSSTGQRKTTTSQSNKVAARRAGQSSQSTSSSQKPGKSSSTTQSPSASAGSSSVQQPSQTGGSHSGSTSQGSQPSQSGSQNKVIEKHEDSAAIILD